MAPNGRQIRRWVAAAVVVAGLAGPAAAQDNALERAKLLRAIADQKAADDVLEAVRSADVLARSDAKRAAEKLRLAQTGLDVSAGISSAKRKELTDLLQAKLAALEGVPASPVADPKAVAARGDARKAYDAAVAESKEVADVLSKAAGLAAQGREEEARRLVTAAAAKYPNNPSLLAAREQEGFAVQIQAEKDLSRQYAAAWTENMRDVARSGIPATGDIQFPSKAKWDDLTKRRQHPAVKLTPKEERILESLNKSIGAIFKDRPFEEALQELSNTIDQPIFIDKKSLEDLGLDLSRRVTFQGNVSARTALRAILQTNGLTFVVKDEMIQVMTLEKAQATLVTRSYYLGDLVTGNGQFGNAVQWGPVAGFQQMMQNAQMIVDAITSSVDPMAWNSGKSNGPCTISFNMATMSVVVRASAEVHATLGNSLSGKK